MATYTINAVRLSSRLTHKHIEYVRLSGGAIEPVATVILKIRAGSQYYTSAPSVPVGRVYVHRCPDCGEQKYITTHADSTKKNNLLDLPKF